MHPLQKLKIEQKFTVKEIFKIPQVLEKVRNKNGVIE